MVNPHASYDGSGTPSPPGCADPEAVDTYRRHLPHWRIESAVYFLTWRVRRGEAKLAPHERTAVVSACVISLGNATS